MPSIDTFRKHAKQLVRWHRDGDHSVGGRVRQLSRFGSLSDAQVLGMPFPLALAQEVVAVEAGFADWRNLRDEIDLVERSTPAAAGPLLRGAAPVLLVRDVSASALWFEQALAFQVDFLHGAPPFYGAVSRDGVALHLRHVDQPNFAELAARERSLILALIEVGDVKTLYAEFAARDVPMIQPLTAHAWGGLDFHIGDPDGNAIAFVQYRSSPHRSD